MEKIYLVRPVRRVTLNVVKLFPAVKAGPTRKLHRAKTRVPDECLTGNALGALKMACRAVARQTEGWSARDEWAS
jgi:hypothetical protein